MNKLTFAKIFGGLCIVLAIFATLIDTASFFFPPDSWILNWDPNFETARTKMEVIMFSLGIIGLLPLGFGLISFYLAEGIGNSWLSFFLLGSFLLAILLLPIAVGVQTFLFPENSKHDMYIIKQDMYLISIPLLFYILLSPIVFSAIAFIAGKVSFRNRLLPFVSLALWIIIPVFLAPIVLTLYSITGLGRILPTQLYHGIKVATYPQWLTLGSIGWGLLGLAAFMKEKETNQTNIK